MNPRIYVGTYAKYNNGRMFGEWLDPSDYQDIKEFYDACRELHSNDPLNEDIEHEFMFQDWEDIPDKYIGEGWLSADLWDWLSLDDNERASTAAYWDNVDSSADVEYALDHLAGTRDCQFETGHSAKLNWLNEYLEGTLFFDGWTQDAINYFDDEAYLRDCEIQSYDFVFRDEKLYVFYK